MSARLLRQIHSNHLQLYQILARGGNTELEQSSGEKLLVCYSWTYFTTGSKLDLYVRVTLLVECITSNLNVVGSNPVFCCKNPSANFLPYVGGLKLSTLSVLFINLDMVDCIGRVILITRRGWWCSCNLWRLTVIVFYLCITHSCEHTFCKLEGQRQLHSSHK